MFKLLTEVNGSGNTVFKKKRYGQQFNYFAENKQGQIGEVSKEWIEENIDKIVNVNMDRNGVLFYVDGNKEKKQNNDKPVSMTLSGYYNRDNFTLSNLKLNDIYLIRKDDITSIKECVELKDDKIKIVLDKPLFRVDYDTYYGRKEKLLETSKSNNIFLADKSLYIKEEWLELDNGKYLVEDYGRGSFIDNNYTRRGYKVFTSKKLPLRLKYHIFSTSTLTDTYDLGNQYSISGILKEICKTYEWKVGGLPFKCKTYNEYSKGINKLLEGVPVLLAKQEELGVYLKSFNAKKLEEMANKLKLGSLRSENLSEVRLQIADLAIKELGIDKLRSKYLCN